MVLDNFSIRKICLFLMLVLFISFCSSEKTSGINPKLLKEIRNGYISIYSESDPIPKGSGFLLNEKGEILTCYHIIAGIENNIKVRSGDKFFKAKLIKKDYSLDLALLSSEINVDVREVFWAKQDELNWNDEIFTFATPYGMTESFMKGYVSHTNRSETVTGYYNIPFIQVMGISYPGSSGASVFLNDGRSIGINSTTVTYGAGNGIGFVIPSTSILKFINQN